MRNQLTTRRLNTWRILLGIIDSALRLTFWVAAALTFLLTMSNVAVGQSTETIAPHLNTILEPTTTISNNVATVEFRNNGQKEITGFWYSRTDYYANGMQAVIRRAGGVDFVGTIAQYKALGVPLTGRQLRPGDTYSLTINPPPAPDGSRVTKVQVTVIALTFSDRTTQGDPKVIEWILFGRKQDVQRVDAALTEARGLMAKPDPRGALEARLAAIRKSGANPPGFRLIQQLHAPLATGDQGQIQKLIASWEAMRKALAEHSTVTGGKQP